MPEPNHDLALSAKTLLARAYRDLHEQLEGPLPAGEQDFFEACVRTGTLTHGDQAAIRAILAALSPPTPAETVTVALPGAGEVGFPDIGPDPMKGDRVDRIEQSVATCRAAYVKQQQGVPDQTALVWRWHLGALRECATRLKAILARDSSATVAAANDEGVARKWFPHLCWAGEPMHEGQFREPWPMDEERTALAKAIFDGWYEGNEDWDSPHNDHLQTRAYFAADAAIRLLSQGGGK